MAERHRLPPGEFSFPGDGERLNGEPSRANQQVTRSNLAVMKIKPRKDKSMVDVGSVVLSVRELAVWKAEPEMKRVPLGSFILLDCDWPICSH